MSETKTHYVFTWDHAGQTVTQQACRAKGPQTRETSRTTCLTCKRSTAYKRAVLEEKKSDRA